VPSGKAILLVTQFAPPAGFSAARRVAGLAKYLSRLGHRVTILGSLASGRGPIPGAASVVRTRDLIASPLNWRRGHFESLRVGSDVAYRDAPTRLASLVVPDLVLLTWIPFALPRALRLARGQRFDCVITTSPPESGHLIGLALRARGLPWIADLRDGWTFETTHPEWPTRIQLRLDRALEGAVVARADLVTAVTDPIAHDLRERLGANAVTVSNGFDPEEHPRVGTQEAGLSPGRISLVHTGRMAFAGRSPLSIVDALKELRRRHPKLGERVEVVLAGPLSGSERELIGQAELDGSVRAVGTLPREETLRLQSAADVLLLITGRSRSSEATAKLYEYLAAGRPILVLGEGTAAAEIVRGAGAGMVTSATDPVAIADAIAQLVEHAPAMEGTSPAIERYSYSSIAAELADHLERICGPAPNEL
jgi:glycosyltransferase involved in cell wall biosynthesis